MSDVPDEKAARRIERKSLSHPRCSMTEREDLERKLAAIITEHVEIGYSFKDGRVDADTIRATGGMAAAHMVLHFLDLAQGPANRGALIELLSNAYSEGFGEGMREHASSKGGWPWNARKQKYGALLDKALAVPSTNQRWEDRRVDETGPEYEARIGKLVFGKMVPPADRGGL